SAILMSSLENVRPGIRPRYLSQKMDAKEPEKKIPLMAAKATNRSVNVEHWSDIHLSARSVLRLTQGMVSMASKRYLRWLGSLMYVSMRSE
ncbi:hypothetical protein M405DRAFT_753626, partial [Rhizopogon salebrosus TDB-379]